MTRPKNATHFKIRVEKFSSNLNEDDDEGVTWYKKKLKFICLIIVRKLTAAFFYFDFKLTND